MIKAIETFYLGYKFRSRLEARWAIFMNRMGIEWTYEPEGYDLGEFGYYLPDFWLPQASFHAEVKGDWNIVSKKDSLKLEYFDNYPPGNSLGLIYLIGNPAVWFSDSRFPIIPFGSSCTWNLISRCGCPLDKDKIRNAVDAALSARFEHGETPR